ncbi:hypothetical protein C8A01DRAFT_19029 [Parachaetomium inaequale]|uniref:Uncharacterized protein n=1 Tax=Parachaetomium inaequale TaxID=2588326 RepID=A0AAN6P999_9PEZI|nr:hypothetical protein C8A01DRAFT_19029 [Parachaetomium inaequale]
MADQLQSNIIEDNPIGNGLDAFRASFHMVCTDRTISRVPDAAAWLMASGTKSSARMRSAATSASGSGPSFFSRSVRASVCAIGPTSMMFW